MDFKDFEDYLQDYFIRNNYNVLDDSIPDAMNDWLEELGVDEWISLGDSYKKGVTK